MSRNGSGTYVLPAGNPVVTGTVITSTWANTTLSDIATALTGSIASDGQTVVTGNLQLGNNRITGMADGIAATDAATLGQTTNANIVSGTINGAVIGNTNPQNGTFTNLVATVSATVITLPTTDNSTKAASTAYVKALISSAENVVNSFNGRKGVVTLTSGDVTGALGFTPPSNTGAGASGSWGISVTGTATNVTGIVAAANGGTGLSDAGTAGNILTSTGTGWVSSPPTGVPSGAILMWSGSIASIPAGWFLCDGGNGTPNLIDKFVIAAGGAYAVNATGGNKDSIVVAHTHGVNDPGHAHTINAMNSNASGGGGPLIHDGGNPPKSIVNASGTGISIQGAGQDGTNANLPPYYALAYIMKA